MVDNYIKRIFLRLKIFNNYLRIIRESKFISRKAYSDLNKSVVFDLKDRRLGRYYFNLIYFFYSNGYHVIIKNNPIFIGSCLDFDSYIFKLKGVQILSSFNNVKNLIYITDCKFKQLWSLDWKLKIQLDFDYFNKVGLLFKNHMLFPYSMHPNMYFFGNYSKIQSLRASEKKNRIFFAGNIDDQFYNNSSINKLFNISNRVQIINFLKKALKPDSLILLEQGEQLPSTNDNKIVLKTWKGKSQMGYSIAEADWLRVLSESSFFLACPGVSMPLCHNVIESMAVGTVPILEFPELFNPPLEHLKNCVVFKGLDNLKDLLLTLINMSETELTVLSQNVANYYDQHLSPESFIKMVENIPVNNQVVVFNGENVSVSLFDK